MLALGCPNTEHNFRYLILIFRDVQFSLQCWTLSWLVFKTDLCWASMKTPCCLIWGQLQDPYHAESGVKNPSNMARDMDIWAWNPTDRGCNPMCVTGRAPPCTHALVVAPPGTRYWRQILGFFCRNKRGGSTWHTQKKQLIWSCSKTYKVVFLYEKCITNSTILLEFLVGFRDVVFEWISGKEILGLRFKDMSELKFQCHDDTWALIITLVSWLGYIGDYTTHLHRDANIWIAITVSSQYNGMAQGFWSLLTSILQSQPVHKSTSVLTPKTCLSSNMFFFFSWGVQMGFPCARMEQQQQQQQQQHFRMITLVFSATSFVTYTERRAKTLPQMSLSSCTCFRYI